MGIFRVFVLRVQFRNNDEEGLRRETYHPGYGNTHSRLNCVNVCFFTVVGSFLCHFIFVVQSTEKIAFYCRYPS